MTAPAASIRRPIRRWVALAGLAALVASSAVLAPTTAGAARAPGSADLTASVGHSPASPLAATDLTFTITATNDGPGSASDVLVALSYDYPFQFKSASDGCAVSGQGVSVICHLGLVPAGASASASVTVTPQGSGVYMVPVAVSSETPDPDMADRSVTDTVIVQRGPSQGARYVAGIYPIILGRPADPGAIKYWGDRFQTLARTGQPTVPVPAGIIGSLEGRRVRVRDAYQRILKRAPGNDGLAYWAGRLGRGLTNEGLDRQLLTSSEFLRNNGEDIPGALYRAVLGRAPSPAEVRASSDAIASGRLTYPGLVMSLQHSTKGYDQVINDLFQRTLGRAPTLLDRYISQLELRAGLSGENLWAKLLVSGEFLQNYPPTLDDFYPPPGRPVARPIVPQRYDFTGQATFTR